MELEKVENPKPWKLYDLQRKKPIKCFKSMEELLIARLEYIIKTEKTIPQKVIPVFCPHIPPAEYVRRQRPFSEALK